MLVLSAAAAVVIYCTHPVDPHDEGLLVGTAAFLWPFFLHPLAWLACLGFVVVDFRRGYGRQALIGLLVATAAWPAIFAGYVLNQKPWLSPQAKLQDSWPDVRVRGAFLLGQQAAPEGLPLLIAALEDPESEVRAAATTALGRYGPGAEGAIPALTYALQDKDWFVGCRAGEALGAMRGLQERVLPALVDQLSDGGHYRSWCAAKAISRLGPEAAHAVPALVSLLQHKDPSMRSVAAETLGHIGSAAAPALPHLTRAAGDENQWVRKAAQEALPRIKRGS